VESARAATAADTATVAALWRMGLAELAQGRGGALYAVREARAEPLEETIAAELADPARGLFVGTLDGVVVGFAAVGTERLRDGAVLGVLDGLYVEPEAREVGVGERLIDAVLEWCADHRCTGVDARALPGDRATKNFFEGSGFTARLLVMHRRLEPSP